MDILNISFNDTTLSVTSFGAEAVSFKVSGKEYLWQKDPERWGGSAPILFPLIGELKGEGKTTLFGDRSYHMDIHGFAKDTDMKAVKIGEDTAVFAFSESDETLLQYPFKFDFKVKYRVFDGGYSQTFFIKNKSDKVMPYFVGAHPGFILPNFNDNYDDYTLEFSKPEHNIAYRIDDDTGLVDDKNVDKLFEYDCRHIKVSHKLFSKGAAIFPEIVSREVKLYNNDGNGIKIEFPDFDYFGIWEMAGEEYPYICLEPWTGMNDCLSEDGVFEHKRGVRFINPGKSVELTLRVSLLEPEITEET